jgi:hypothetical protein
MKEHDVEKNNVITFTEFKSIFFDYKDKEYHKDDCIEKLSLDDCINKTED